MIDHSYLLGLYGMPPGGGLGLGGAASGLSVKKKQPTAPWQPGAEKSEPSDLVRGALAGRRLISEGAARIDLAGASADYRKLFALYQGLNTLSALADRAAGPNISSRERDLLEKRFAAGLAEVGAYARDAAFEGIRVTPGTVAASAKSTAAVVQAAPRLTTRPVHEGALSLPVAAFEGDVRFDIHSSNASGSITVSIDLAEMGTEPRTLDAVIGHINGKLSDAGAEVRIHREKIEAEPRTLKAGGKTITLSPGVDRWALVVQGGPVDTVRFSAPQTSDAVYVVQANGAAGGQQVLKFQTDDGDAPAPPTGLSRTNWVEGRASQTGLPDGVETVRASATGPDGSLWLVADVGRELANRPIKGERDVALMKLDSSGRVLATRMLGASASASGYAIAVAEDGRVAVAGSVTGALEPGQTVLTAGEADSFVSVFDADGDELWTQRRGARAADEATAVSFGADGVVYVAGRAKSAMPGGAGVGGWDGYLQGFTATQAHSLAPLNASSLATSQFGTAGDDGVSAMTVEGADLYTAGVENGRAVVRRWTLDGDGRPVLSASRDLGAASGDIRTIAVDGGRVVLGGTTRNGALDVGQVTTAHSGGTDAFLAVLVADLGPDAGDRLTYFGGSGDDTAADVKVHDGKVWITGVSDRPPGAGDGDSTRGYLARIDPTSGQVEWSRSWSGDDQQAAPATLAIAADGASVLDRLGLPHGLLAPPESKTLISATALRAGDRFYVSPASGGRPMAVTIDARDTLQTLARRVEQASLGRLRATVMSEKIDGVSHQRLSITPREGREGAILTAGEPGRDALAALGLSQGLVRRAGADEPIKSFGLDLPARLSLLDPDAIKAAQARLNAAMTMVRSAYRALSPDASKPAPIGPAPAYQAAQIANYQAALNRLMG